MTAGAAALSLSLSALRRKKPRAGTDEYRTVASGDGQRVSGEDGETFASRHVTSGLVVSLLLSLSLSGPERGGRAGAGCGRQARLTSALYNTRCCSTQVEPGVLEQNREYSRESGLLPGVGDRVW